MILLDTNVLSELMRPEPAEPVLAWMRGQAAAELYVSSISYAEILYAMFAQDFAGRVMSFDPASAPAFAAIAGVRRRAGKPIHPVDAMIAAIARTHGAAIATRDRDLKGCGVPVVNPWEAA